MMQFGLIGLGSGAAAALLFASLTSGVPASFLLANLAPLPLMIVALGWSHWAALIGMAVASIAIWLFFGGLFVAIFIAGVGVPGWWLGYLAMLARPVDRDGRQSLEWYPAGRLVLWSVVLGAASMIVFILLVQAMTGQSILDIIRKAFQAFLDAAATSGTRTGLEVLRDEPRLLDMIVSIMPPGAAALQALTIAINLWLAGRIVKFSNRLTRPWPALDEIAFPSVAAAALAVAFVFSLAGGTIGVIAGVISSTLTMGFSLIGFAVIHALTKQLSSRGFLIAAVYASVVILSGWPLLIIAMLGLADTLFNFRARAAIRRGGGPLSPT